MRRQLVPCLWARRSECTGAEVRRGGADHEVAASGRSKSLSAADWYNWPAEIGDIRRCQTMERLERQLTQLELDVLCDAKPVKWWRRWWWWRSFLQVKLVRVERSRSLVRAQTLVIQSAIKKLAKIIRNTLNILQNFTPLSPKIFCK